jgi:hypothetical protein
VYGEAEGDAYSAPALLLSGGECAPLGSVVYYGVLDYESAVAAYYLARLVVVY